MSEAARNNPETERTVPSPLAHGACAAFRAAWEAELAPRLEDFLAAVADEERPNLLYRLVRLDVFFRKQHGLLPQPQDYLQRFATLDPEWLEQTIDRPAEFLFGHTPAERPSAIT